MKFQTPSDFSFQVIEDITLITIDSAKMEQLYIPFPQWQALGGQVWKAAFRKVVENMRGIFSFNWGNTAL